MALEVSNPELNRMLDFYNEELRPQLEAYDEVRQSAVKKFWVWLAVIVGLGFAVAAYAYYRTQNVQILLFIAVPFLIIIFVVRSALIKPLKDYTKSTIMTGLTDVMGWTYSETLAAEPDIRLFSDNYLVPRFYDRIGYEDEIRGQIQGVNFTAFECHMERETRDSKGRSSWQTVFRGTLIQMDFGKDFLGRTLVLRDRGIFNSKNKSNLKRVGLVDPVFEKIFEAYGSDQVEARYLLTPDFMQKLVDLEHAVDGKRIRFAFSGGDLLIAVETQNRFEAGSMFRPLADEARIQRYMDEFSSLYQIIDMVIVKRRRRAV